MMQKTALHFSYGLRFIYLAIPFFFYVAGPIALVVATGLTLIFLFLFDLPRAAKPNRTSRSSRDE